MVLTLNVMPLHATLSNAAFRIQEDDNSYLFPTPLDMFKRYYKQVLVRDLMYRQLQPGVPAGEQLEWKTWSRDKRCLAQVRGSLVGPISLTVICHLKKH